MSQSEEPRGFAEAAEGRESGAVEEILAYAEKFIDFSGLELTADVHCERDALVVQMGGADASLLLDHHGEVLDALQTVFGKILPRRFGTTLRVLVDAAGYRVGRERELVQIAQLTAEKVRKMGQPIELSPMNANERRIVHLALAGTEGVSTESQGDGEIKRVMVLPSSEK